ncbi:MAG: ABC transporter permease subunit [Dehalococcoidia bacterium]|nr:ABC transporter permease subunit [Dehalococcoidia bacterium]
MAELATSAERRRPGPWGTAVRRLRKKKLAMAGLVIIAVVYGSGILAEWIAPYDQEVINVTAEDSDQPPSWEHPFGTDRLGRDRLTQSMFAARTTVVITMATLLTGGGLIGVGLGMLAGYRRGWIDAVIMRSGEVLSALPGLLMLILITATLRPRYDGWVLDFTDATGLDWVRDTGFADMVLIFGVLSLFFWVGTARIIRSQVLALRESEYILAAHAMGASTSRIIWKHLFPNILPIVVVGMSASLGAITSTEILLSYLGLGVNEASFGRMLFEGGSIRTLQAHPHLLLIPGAIVAALIFAFNLVGDALNDSLAPRGR